MKIEPLLIINPKLKDMLREDYPQLTEYLEEFSDTEGLLLNKYCILNSERRTAKEYNKKFEEEDFLNDIVRYMEKHKIEF